MTTWPEKALDDVFGADSVGQAPEERALTSKRQYIRGLTQLTRYEGRGAGRVLSASEALDAYGMQALVDVESEGTAVLSAGRTAAGSLLRLRREALGLGLSDVAKRARLPEGEIRRAEASDLDLGVRRFEAIARALGLDDRTIGFMQVGPREDLAGRLRALREDDVLTPRVVALLAEASWIASVQTRLERRIGLANARSRFTPSSNYGGPNRPAYVAAYDLARAVRSKLDLGAEPIERLTALCEDTLAIPVIRANLGDSLAGATIDAGDARGIVVNYAGQGSNLWVQRSTLAHELGHLLFDPAERLKTLRVDDWHQLERDPTEGHDPVEQRANAFAVELIAPQKESVELFLRAGGVSANALDQVIDRFGIGFTSARLHVWHGLNKRTPLTDLRAPNWRPQPHWVAREEYTVAYHPIASLVRAPERAGRFSAVVACAAERGLISWDSAAEYLLTTDAEIRGALPALQELYPAVFGAATPQR